MSDEIPMSADVFADLTPEERSSAVNQRRIQAGLERGEKARRRVRKTKKKQASDEKVTPFERLRRAPRKES